jgi:hypothetical protein
MSGDEISKCDPDRSLKPAQMPPGQQYLILCISAHRVVHMLKILSKHAAMLEH